jgi:hypothetical protein
VSIQNDGVNIIFIYNLFYEIAVLHEMQILFYKWNIEMVFLLYEYVDVLTEFPSG